MKPLILIKSMIIKNNKVLQHGFNINEKPFRLHSSGSSSGRRGPRVIFAENADGAKWCHVSKASLNVVGRPRPTKSATDPALNPLLLYPLKNKGVILTYYALEFSHNILLFYVSSPKCKS